jgi:hypothetical protein
MHFPTKKGGQFFPAKKTKPRGDGGGEGLMEIW